MHFLTCFGLIFICLFTLVSTASPNKKPKKDVFKNVECDPDIVGEYLNQLRGKPSQATVFTLQQPLTILRHVTNIKFSEEIHQKSRRERFNLGHFKGADDRIHCMFCDQISRGNVVKSFMAQHYLRHLRNGVEAKPSCQCKVTYKKKNFKPLCCYIQLADNASNDASSSINIYDFNPLYDDSDADRAYGSDSDITITSIADWDSGINADAEFTKSKNNKYGFFPFVEEKTNTIRFGCFSCESLIAKTFLGAWEHIDAHEAYESEQSGCKACKLVLRDNEQQSHNCQLAWEVYQEPLSYEHTQIEHD